VEFLVDRHRRFYLLEMNTRLQVEHTVKEMTTGLDLVKEQIRVAAGEELSIRQPDVALRGAAIECRIYAEDPENSFFPSPGKIVLLRTPAGPGIRDDGGVYEGWTVPIDYDPLISKLVAWGSTRDEAIARMRRALSEYKLEGIKTNISFFLEVLAHPGFRKGDFDTSFIDRWLKTRTPAGQITQSDRHIAALAAALFQSERTATLPDQAKSSHNAWKLDARRRGLRNS
jgi:acetyl-CoA carboxylase biotin carboxylase subunit